MILCPVHRPAVSAEQIGRLPGRLIVTLALAILFALSSPAQSQTGAPAGADAAAGRRIAPLDLGWKFHRGDDYGAIRPDFDDKNWQDVTLPHSFNGADGDDGGGYYRGPAWYRLTLPARKPAAWAGPPRAAAGTGSSGGRAGLSAVVGTSRGPMLMVHMSCAACGSAWWAVKR